MEGTPPTPAISPPIFFPSPLAFPSMPPTSCLLPKLFLLLFFASWQPSYNSASSSHSSEGQPSVFVQSFRRFTSCLRLFASCHHPSHHLDSWHLVPCGCFFSLLSENIPLIGIISYEHNQSNVNLNECMPIAEPRRSVSCCSLNSRTTSCFTMIKLDERFMAVEGARSDLHIVLQFRTWT